MKTLCRDKVMNVTTLKGKVVVLTENKVTISDADLVN